MFGILGTGVKCRISLNDPERVYCLGDLIEGYIEFITKRDARFEKISISLIGSCTPL